MSDTKWVWEDREDLNTYKKEYDEAILEIVRLEKLLRESYSICEKVCLETGKSSWCSTTPKKMAEQCAYLINQLSKKSGYCREMPYRHIASVMDIRDFIKLKKIKND
jgi:hypothetical protein